MSEMNGHRYEDGFYEDPLESFEKERIKALKDERVHIQKKTFTKWCNSFLSKVRLEVIDLFRDLSDGILLLALLEIISGEPLGKPNRGRMRVHKIENLNRVLTFLKRKRIQLENIGAEDILDGNERLILGLIWTIILRFQIEEIEITVPGDDLRGEKKSAKDALLLWCQMKTEGYPHVKIENFTSSWRSGMGFNALIHAHRPDLIDYEGLKPQDALANLNNAFDVAEKQLGLHRLLDAEDVNVSRPDEKSIMTYIATYYHYFAKQKSETTGAKRISKLVGMLLNADKTKQNYEHLSSSLLKWIQTKIRELSNRNFPNNLQGIQQEMILFKQYRTSEKPPRFKEKGELEALFFAIQTRLKSLGSKSYVPPHGMLLSDIEHAWEQLERAENARQVALYAELMRQEKLQQLAGRFEMKAKLRDAWLREMIALLDEFTFDDLSNVEHSLKKHQAIATNVAPRAPRFDNLREMANKLSAEGYFDKDRIQVRAGELCNNWKALNAKLQQMGDRLHSFDELVAVYRDIDALHAEFSTISQTVRLNELAKDVVSTDNLLHKHSLMEAHVASQGELMDTVLKRADACLRADGVNQQQLAQAVNEVKIAYKQVTELCQARRQALEASRKVFQFIQDEDELETWITERTGVCNSILENRAAKMNNLPQIQRYSKALTIDQQAYLQQVKNLMSAAERLLPKLQGRQKDEVQTRQRRLETAWNALRGSSSALAAWLEEASRMQQYLQDANEAESWLLEKTTLASSADFGKDDITAQTALARHVRMMEEIQAYKAEIDRLNEMAKGLEVPSKLQDERGESPDAAAAQQASIGRVQAMHPYNGHGMDIKKGEMLVLLEKTNDDWWRVVRSDGQEGFVPAAYVQEVPSLGIAVNGHTEPGPGVQTRQEQISAKYQRLLKLAQARKRDLETMVKIFEFIRDTEEFKDWVHDTEHLLKEEVDPRYVEACRRKFDQLVTDIVTNGCTRLKTIDAAADALEATRPGQDKIIDAWKVQSRRLEVHDMWKQLLRQRDAKARELEKAESLAAFERNCDETHSWIDEKLNQFRQTGQAQNDFKGLELMQRKHQNLEREIRPIEEKMKLVGDLGSKAGTAYPEQKPVFSKRMQALNDKWHLLKDLATTRRSELEQNRGTMMFQDASSQLFAWMEGVRKRLDDFERPLDVAMAEKAIEQHGLLGDEMKEKSDEFQYVSELADRIRTMSPANSEEVARTLAELQRQRSDLERRWFEKQALLETHLDLEIWVHEADHIDAATKLHEAFLDYQGLEDTVEALEAQLKQLNEFENKLNAQEDRLRAFHEMGEKLIAAKHWNAPEIAERRSQTFAMRNAVRERLRRRRADLEDALLLCQFMCAGEELLAWIRDKMKIAQDDSYKDLANLERKLKKHEAFQAELKANSDRLDKLKKEGQTLMRKNNETSDRVKATLNTLDKNWKELEQCAAAKGDKLKQAYDKLAFLRNVDGLGSKIGDLETTLQSTTVGVDLRSVKELLNQHQAAEHDLANCGTKVDELCATGKDLVAAGHYDAPTVEKSANRLKQRHEALKDLAKRRRAALEHSARLHQLFFDLALEQQWVREKLLLAGSKDYGSSLTHTISLVKKHQKLENEIQGHRSVIDAVLAQGKRLLAERHEQSAEIKRCCDELEHDWSDLVAMTARRTAMLNLVLKAQHYWSDAADLEQWLGEKREAFSSRMYGTDEDSATKLLKAHQLCEAELETAQGRLDAMDGKCKELRKEDYAEAAAVEEKQETLRAALRDLEQLYAGRLALLNDAVCLYQYLKETQDLEDWINAQLQCAMSEDYGQDYEHFLVIAGKFEDFKQNMRIGSARFIQCETAAKSLLERDPPFAREIQQRQEQLRSAWALLLDYVESRDQKLEGAEEIHRFNHEVAEMIERIQEKYVAMEQGDLGKDLNAVQVLIRKHEAVESELTALETQLQALLNEGARLMETFPGGNAEYISAQQQLLYHNWNALRDKSVERREALRLSYDVQRFLKAGRDFCSWGQQLRQLLKVQQLPHDLDGCELAYNEHQQYQLEIQAHKNDFTELCEFAAQLAGENNPKADEVSEKLTQIKDIWSALHDACAVKELQLNNLLVFCRFMRDVEQMNSALAGSEAFLKGQVVGDSVESIAENLAKLDTRERLLSAHEEKLGALVQQAAKLVAAKHPESKVVDNEAKAVQQRWKNLLALAAERRKQLQAALHYAKFDRASNEAQGWVNDRLKQLEQPAGAVPKADNSLRAKVQQLQKHQAFEAELTANAVQMKTIKDDAIGLIGAKHPNKPAIEQRLASLESSWDLLRRKSQEKSASLEEARDILKFNQLAERVIAWMQEKELLVNTGDLGNDYEHCVFLQRKLGDTEHSGGVNEEVLTEMDALSRKIEAQGQETGAVKDKLAEIKERWTKLQNLIASYKKRLGMALAAHELARDVADTSERVANKTAQVSGIEDAEDLPVVELNLRRQDAVERDVVAIQEKLKEHERVAEQLRAAKNPLNVDDKLAKLGSGWDRLCELLEARRTQLRNSYMLQKFLSDVKECDDWVSVTHREMEQVLKTVNPLTVEEALVLRNVHNDKKAELARRQEAVTNLCEFGEHLAKEQPKRDAVVHEKMKDLRQAFAALEHLWSALNERLLSLHDVLALFEQTRSFDDWIRAKESQLASDDTGDSVAAVDKLLNKHEHLEQTIRAQQAQLDHLRQLCSSMSKAKDEAHMKTCATYSEDLKSRYEHLLALCEKRSHKLQDARRLHEFLERSGDFIAWLNTRLQIAYDKTYHDSTNLKAKLLKHQTFQSEISAGKERLDALKSEARELIDADHFAKDRIRRQMKEMEDGWRDLMLASGEKQTALQNAHDANQLSAKIVELNTSLDVVESQLQSEDHGKDLTSVRYLQKKHKTLEEDFNGKAEHAARVADETEQFVKRVGDDFRDLMSEAKHLKERAQSLEEPCQIRAQNLKDAEQVYAWLHDLDDELVWIREKQPVLQSPNYGDSLETAQKLLNKHKIHEQELGIHEVQIADVATKGRSLVRGGHFAKDLIEQRTAELLGELKQLKDAAAARRLALEDSVEAKMYLSDALEMLDLLNEYISSASINDVTFDEQVVIAQQKSLDAIAKSSDHCQQEIQVLNAKADKLVAKQTLNGDLVRRTQAELQNNHRKLQMLIDERRKLLQETSKFCVFTHRVEELMGWLRDKHIIANSEEYGKDLEHCQALVKEYEEFLRDVSRGGEQVAALQRLHDEMIRANHNNAASVRLRNQEVQQSWSLLNEATVERKQALVGACEVHRFDEAAEETLSWLQEKEAMLLSAHVDYNNSDLPTLQALELRHAAFMKELDVAEAQAKKLGQEADRLTAMFPNTLEHINSRRHEVDDLLHDVKQAAQERAEKLRQAEQLQAYFDEFRELSAWINDMFNQITSEVIARSPESAQAALQRHLDKKSEIDAKAPVVKYFVTRGRQMIAKKHLLSAEIQGKVGQIESSFDALLQLWDARKTLCDQILDAQVWIRNSKLLNQWLDERKGHLGDDWKQLTTVPGLEAAIRQYDDFMSTLQVQDEKCEQLKQHTLIELAYAKEKAAVRKFEDTRTPSFAAKDKITTVEKQNLLHERRQERERRRTREINYQAALEAAEKAESSPTPKRVVNISPSHSLHRTPSEKVTREVTPIVPVSRPTYEAPTVPSVQTTSAQPVPATPPQYVNGAKSSDEDVSETTKESPPASSKYYGTPRAAPVTTEGTPQPPPPTSSYYVTPHPPVAMTPPKIAPKPAFTTRRRSLKDDVSKIEKDGFLERKQEFQAGGRKSAIRSWKNYYTVLCGQLLCFFKDQTTFAESHALAPPVYILNAQCGVAEDYTKRKHVFKLATQDGAEYLFGAASDADMQDWVAKISFHARLPPSLQLKHYDSAVASSVELSPPRRAAPPVIGSASPGASSQSSSLRRPVSPDSGDSQGSSSELGPPPPVVERRPSPAQIGVSASPVKVDELKRSTVPRSASMRSEHANDSQDFVHWIEANAEDGAGKDGGKKRNSRLGNLFKSRKKDTEQ